ncbi:MAG: phosphatidylinositol-specific phospholipase C/glycerophosphodiester phosphodiesterase family protein [Planctomycetaceae bacterium]|jgi:hypothetical protein|nr:phosphatidylinositol-specific phospholipase C/glycerophosphodiester phosphodiesterase family protein [Planctomycetaceae bacterium]
MYCRLLLSGLLAAQALWTTPLLAEQVTVLPKSHAHNDYEHERPLFDALDNGFCSVEADIFLADGQLLVGHNRKELQPKRTLEALYLKPLLERYQKNNGKIFSDAENFYLLIDLKENGEDIYPVLCSLLAKYDDVLTSFDGEKKNTKAILVILSGNSPKELVLNEKGRRYVTLDGNLSDLDSTVSVDLMPLISSSWKSSFTWDGKGTMPAEQLTKFREQVQKVHKAGRMIRYWGAPDNTVVWKLLYQNGIDFINTDKLLEFRKAYPQLGQ